MIIIFACHAKKLAIPYELHHEMDDVESIVRTSFRLMDVAEVGFMHETRRALPSFLDLNVASPHAKALESGIQNIHYVGVVLLFEVPGRVEIHVMGDSREKNDKDGVPLAVQNKCTSN